MLYCEKCGVKVKGRPDFCPLCQAALSGTAEADNAFPVIRKKPNTVVTAIRILGFISVAAICICGAVNYSEADSFGGWWLYVVAGILSFWIPFAVAYRLRGNLIKSVVFTGFFCCLVAFFWDLGTGYAGWSLDFVLPISCCFAMLVMFVMARILNLHIEQYIYYLIIDIIFGIVPLILLLFGVIRFIYPSVACIAASVIFLTALLIFEGKALKAELFRRTHL